MSNKKESRLQGSARGTSKGAEQIAAAGIAGKSRGVRSQSLRFSLAFCALLVIFQALFEIWLSRTTLFASYLSWNASASAVILRWAGEAAYAAGDQIQSSRYGLTIRKGCDAIQPSAVYVAGILAMPSKTVSKVIGILVGCVLLLALNLIRIVSLYYLGLFRPDAFLIAHEAVWPAVFILLALVLWLAWSLRALRPSRAAPLRWQER